ncbi:MAG TPA: DedA family protein [Candidatus Moranbacteria bacterium]|nr:DedA family protein [Candidatus Moranbacteria bacterium]
MITSIIAFLAKFIVAGISKLGYLGVVLMMAIESACIPLPSEIIMPFSGYLVSTGRFTLWGVAVAGAFGCVVGSVVAYWIGYYGGRKAVEKYGRYLLISRRDLDMADRFFEKYGNWAVFISRLLPVIRTFISLPVGVARMKFWPFVVYTFLGSLPFCYFLAYVGKKMGDNWDTLGGYFHKFDVLIIFILFIGFVWYVRRHLKHRKEEAAEITKA